MLEFVEYKLLYLNTDIFCLTIWLCFSIASLFYILLIFRSRLYTYDDVVERVAQQVGLDDPSKIRLTPHNCYSQQPKPQPIKYRGVEHLSDMLVHYNQVVIIQSHRISIIDTQKDLIPFFEHSNVRLRIYCTMKYLTSRCQNCKV